MSKKNTISTEIIHKEIDLVQNCISRMANNSFLLKGWSISLISVILAIIYEKINLIQISLILAIIILYFWYLDAYFLREERKYRKLYEWIIKQRPKKNNKRLYSLNAHRFDKDVDSIIDIMKSKTLKWFYGIPFTISIIVLIYNLMPILCRLNCNK